MMRPRRIHSRLERWRSVSRIVVPDLILTLGVVAFFLVGFGLLDLGSPFVVGAPFTLALFLYRLRER